MESLRSSEDFRDLLSAFNAQDVRYLIAGGFALAHYEFPRYTEDLDLWIDPHPQNARRVFAALSKFGAALEKPSVQDFSDLDCVFQIGVEPILVDLLTDISGLDFESAWGNRVTSACGEIPVAVISRADYIRNKRAGGRASDLRDITTLEDDSRIESEDGEP